jgi:hypothetical protein
VQTARTFETFSSKYKTSQNVKDRKVFRQKIAQLRFISQRVQDLSP